MEEYMVIILAIATYLLFNAVITMLILEDKEVQHKALTAVIMVLFGLPIIIITVVIAIIIVMIEAIGGFLK